MILTHGANSLQYSGNFFLLNNCDNLDNKVIHSLAGPDLLNSDDCVELVRSTVFSESNSIRVNKESILNNAYSTGGYSFNYNEYITIETMYSQMQTGVYAGWQHIDFGSCAFDYDSNDRKIRICVYNNYRLPYTLYNNATLSALYDNVIYIKTGATYTNYAHCAAVIDVKNLCIYAFVNGIIQCKISISSIRSGASIYFKCDDRYSQFNIEFLSIRNGDFSNNLQSFTVPTQKYTLNDA